ncbi:glycosyl hydrolase family 61-domain-containing protein [Desarmillaria ectypa]|nr:glycosyl hydrolase family 61-domain-containing protein [Desarmillaria ectypa]
MIQAKNVLFVLVTAAALLADARTVFSAVSVNGVDQGHAVGVRVPSSNAPITDIDSNGLICNTNFIQPISDEVIKVAAGDKITAQFHHTSAGYVGPDPSDPLDPTNKGLKWFKIWQDGYDPVTRQWGSDHLFINGGNATFTIPSCLASGNYLLRAESVNLLSASFYPGAQFFMSCAQLSISGSTAFASPATVSFPGAYTIADPGIITSIFGLTSYTPPEATAIGSYVNSLSLHEGSGRSPREHLWLCKALPTLSHCLPNVRNLTIDCIVPDTFSPSSWAALLNGFPKVTSFSLLFARFTTPTEALQLIASFPRMTSLYIERLGFIEDPRRMMTNSMIAPPPELTTLSLQQMYLPFLLDWLTRYTIGIRSATFTSVYSVSLESIGKFAHLLGPSLEHISLCEPETERSQPGQHGRLHFNQL